MKFYIPNNIYALSVKYCHSDEENFSLLANMRPIAVLYFVTCST